MSVVVGSHETAISLDDPRAQLPEAAGRKAATLARLTAAGFPVPRGVVLTREACDRILLGIDRAGEPSLSDITAIPFPDDILASLATIESDLGAGGARSLAARSSGIAEDLPGASFAGQYETVLDVVGVDALEAAIRRCLASAFSLRVSAYAHRMDGRAPMAVLVQEMVPADTAGVAFTANPMTGDAETLVSAVRGLGDRLVGGEATPDEWVVRDGKAERRSGAEDAIDAATAGRVAELAARVEATLGGPQDIEWAIAGGSLYLLQARPITALPRKPEFDPPAVGFWMRDDGHYTMPLTPFGASVYLPAINRGIVPMGMDYGLLFDGVEQRVIGGDVYIRTIPPGGKERKAPPWWVLGIVARLDPALRRRARIADSAIRSGLGDRLIDRWYGEWRDAFRAEGAALRARNLAAMSDNQLMDHLADALDFLGRGEEVHFRLFAPYCLATYQLATVGTELLGWTPLETMTLLTGTSDATSAPGRSLAGLAATIASDPAALAALQGDARSVLVRLREVAPNVAVSMETYLEEFGHRVLGYDPAEPTLAERPELLVGLLLDRLGSAHERRQPAAGQDARLAAVARAREALAKRSAAERDRFERALAAAERVYPTREDTVVWTDSGPAAVVRYAMLEFGRRLASLGVIATSEDAAYLEIDELRDALQGRIADGHALVARRRAERAWVAAHPGPASYGPDPGPPPDLRGLPPSLRYVMTAVMWAMKTMILPQSAEAAKGTLVGVPGSPGRHTGTVRVIHDESEFGNLRPGDILVCPVTTPSWSILFGQAGAVVTDGGGVLAHAALIAREYGIPAVLATKDGTRRLLDGQLVTVDGTAGVVAIA